MKKLLLLTLTAFIALTSYAKTQQEIISEYKALSTNKAKAIYVYQNKDDILKVWKANQNTKLTTNSITSFKTNSDERTLKNIFAKLYDCNADNMNASDIEVVYIQSGKIKDTKSVEWYNQIKADGFKINNTSIAEYDKVHLICRFLDDEEVLKVDMSKYYTADFYIKALQNALLNIDAVEAKKICSKLEKLYIVNDRTTPDRVKALSKYLTQAILDSKLTK